MNRTKSLLILSSIFVAAILLFLVLSTAAQGQNHVTNPNFTGGLSGWNVTGCWNWTNKPVSSAKAGPTQFGGLCTPGSTGTLTQSIYIPPGATVISYSHQFLMVGNGNVLSTTISGNGFHWDAFYHDEWTPCYCTSPITHTALPISDTYLTLAIFTQYNTSLGAKATGETVTTNNDNNRAK